MSTWLSGGLEKTPKGQFFQAAPRLFHSKFVTPIRYIMNLSTCADTRTDIYSFFLNQVLCVSCQLSGDRCQMSGVRCYMMHVTCQLPPYAQQDAATDLDLDPLMVNNKKTKLIDFFLLLFLTISEQKLIN